MLGLHARDESRFAPREPDAVAFAHTTEEVSAILRTCSEHGVPVIPFGAGSSLEGHVLPVHGGLSLDLTGMDRVLEVNAEDLDCRVQAGVHRIALEKQLGQDGLFFAVDPGADATLGGMAATAASGTRTTRYGTMRENVLGLQAVLADGTVIQTGSRARKSSAGYDLTRLLLGSEGTLAVITELMLRIHGIPEEIAAARCVFEDLDGAVATVTEAVQLGIPMARCELLDPAAIRAVNAHDELAEPEAYTLFLEFHGGPRSVAEQVESVREIAAGHGGGELQWTTTTDERNKLWRARHNAYFAVVATRPGTRARRPTSACRCRGWPRASPQRRRRRGAAVPGRDGRPRGRRQLPLDLPRRHGLRGRAGGAGGLRRADGHARAGGRRHMHGRARRRHRQARGAARAVRRGRRGDDARAQARARPGGDPQPRQGAAGITLTAGGGREYARLVMSTLAVFAAAPSKVPFYVAGGVLALWAVVLAALGSRGPGSPSCKRAGGAG